MKKSQNIVNSDKVSGEDFDIEKYKHLSMLEIVKLEDEELRSKLVAYHASMIPDDAYDNLEEGGIEFLEDYGLSPIAKTVLK